MKKENKNLFIAGLILGLGLLGAIDGIVFHQLLQWHHMVLSDNIQLEIFTDGLFTALFSAKLLWGGVKIFQDARKNQLGSSWRIFLGGIFIGGGAFNLVEGIIDHHILQVHRVKPLADNPLMYDLAFLAIGALLVVIGLMIKRLEQDA
ncbi:MULTISPECIES: DUF2243 domain-containing protein [unclassified Bacillus (in: firmicutes)]|uniref:DUF2243 domain-containing protein n=1 Tax=unclassified Bacillus (in: firmicutes) TaxID=185979 RepID=UPI001BE9B405|nr:MULTISPECIES: DUF2243 domain-containing protein [unclassified Bacillus (in: firmicutes)]MBT2640376.1 DUF2243 domain-containing protein [Bacillus sp. ISL-39]MBT2662290.1 DUF2243 domain-containing protein [Bacillus sp. ISL-45]